MITRIVKLEFEADRIDDFLQYFETIKQVVNNFPGCLGMKLYQDLSNPNIIMTYSHWLSTEDLENYRNSGEFGEIWPKIKPWFADRPEAWTVKCVFDGFQLKQL